MQCIFYLIAATLVAACVSSCSIDTNEPEKNAQTPPNVLLVVIDDLGFTDLGSYGSEIRTPNLDDLARDGLRFSSFYVSPNCAPTRSMLLSGMDHHLSGNGTMLEHIAENQRGRPGYEGRLGTNVASLPEVLRQSGYRTYMAGKWHLGADEDSSPAARGFDRSFALLLGGASHFSDKMGLVGRFADAPYREDGELVEHLPNGFYSTIFYTDKIIEYVENDRNRAEPFFAYLSYTAVHWPLQVPEEAMDLYAGTYDQGYDALRDQRVNGVVERGILPGSLAPSPGSPTVQPWDSLDESAKRVQSKKMEIYAAMLELVDDNFGRLIKYLQEAGELENTLVIVMSDNGAEGNNRFNLGGDDWIERTFDHSYEQMGREGSYVYYGPGWAQASASPFRLWKAHPSEGGIRAPLIASGSSVKGAGSVSHSIATVKDIMPTILDIAGVEPPVKTFEGREVLPMKGRSMKRLLAGSTTKVHSDEEVFGWEIFGGRAVRYQDWKLVWVAGPNGQEKWELFNLAKDPGETKNLALEMPSIFQEMKLRWLQYSVDNNVILPEGDLRGPWGDE